MAACVNPRLFRHRRTHQYWVAACTRWVCCGCIRKVAYQWRKILNWAAQHGSHPSYLITLTHREPLPLWRQAPAEQQEALREQAHDLARQLTRALSRLVEEIRAKHGAFEYLAVVELTTGQRTPGHRPHLHLLARGQVLSARWLSSRWRFHTKGSFKVDIQRLRSPQQAGDYLMGYTVAAHKQAQREHLTDWPGPRIRYSRGFFPKPVPEIRKLLWPPSDEPGMWEYLCSADRGWQMVWQWCTGDGPNPPSQAMLGFVPRKHRKEPRGATAKPGCEDRSEAGAAQAQVSLPQWLKRRLPAAPAAGLSSRLTTARGEPGEEVGAAATGLRGDGHPQGAALRRGVG